MVAFLFVPLYVQTSAWLAALGPTGWLLAVPNSTWKLTGWHGAIWIHGLSAVPIVALFVRASLKNVPAELEEEAIQSAPARRVLTHISLPHSAPGIYSATIWIAVLCFSEITVTDMFQVRTFAEEVYTAASLGTLTGQPAPIKTNSVAIEVPELINPDLWHGALFIGLVIVSSILALWQLFQESNLATVDKEWQIELKQLGWPLSLGTWFLVFLIIGIPLVSLVTKAGEQVQRIENQTVISWSASKATKQIVRSPWEHRRELGWSLSIGCLAAACALVTGTLIAWALVFRGLSKIPIVLLLSFCFAIPGPILAVWLINFMNRPDQSSFEFLTWWYDYTIMAPTVVQFIRALPLATLVLSVQFNSVPRELLENAESEGANSWHQLFSIIVPLRLPGIAAAFCLSLLVAISDMAGTLLVLPPGVTTISTRIFGLIHYGAEDRVAALSFTLVMAIGLLALWTWRLFELGMKQR